jgi:hypothetical protein
MPPLARAFRVEPAALAIRHLAFMAFMAFLPGITFWHSSFVIRHFAFGIEHWALRHVH